MLIIYYYNNSVVQCGNGCLYNILDDPSERIDLAASNPDVLSMMINRLVELNNTLWVVDRGPSSTLACNAGVLKWGGFLGTFFFCLFLPHST